MSGLIINEKEYKTMNVKSKVSNIVKATKLSYKIYKAMEQGEKVETVKTVPMFSIGCGFLDTVEGCYIHNRSHSCYIATDKAFNTLSREIKGTLSNTPESGEMKQRVELWKEVLKPMQGKEYHKAIGFICADYRRIKALKCGVN